MCKCNKSNDDIIDELTSRFKNYVVDLITELNAANNKITELKKKLSVAEFNESTLGNCCKCGEYKYRPWRDDEYGKVCVSCAIKLNNNSIPINIVDNMSIFLQGALDCTDWFWDNDQRDAAEYLLNQYKQFKKEIDVIIE